MLSLQWQMEKTIIAKLKDANITHYSYDIKALTLKAMTALEAGWIEL